MPGKCMNDAGILDENDKLTLKAKNKFIQDVIDEMRFGTPEIAIPCGSPVSPIPFAEMVDLFDDQMYADWHATWPPKFEALAQALNVKGGIPLFPIADLTVILKILKPDIDVSLGLKALKIPIDIPMIVLYIPDFKPPDFPKLANIEVELPKIPPFDIPSFKFDLGMIGLGFFLNALLKLPELVIDLAVPPKIDLLVPLSIPDLLGNICKKVREKVVPPNPNGKGVDLSYLAATLVLARKCSELAMIAMTACIIGSSPVGVVGGMGADRGYRDPPGETNTPQPPTQEVAYDQKDDEFWNHYIWMCNRLEADPLELAEIIQYEGQWGTYTKNTAGSKAMGLVQIMPFLYQGSNVGNWPRGLRMRPQYWWKLYNRPPADDVSFHASDDLFWTEQYFLNTVFGGFGKTMKGMKKVYIYNTFINPQWKHFSGATIDPRYLINIKSAMARISPGDKGTRLKQPDGLKSAMIDWTTVAPSDIISHPYEQNKTWWRNLPEVKTYEGQ